MKPKNSDLELIIYATAFFFMISNSLNQRILVMRKLFLANANNKGADQPALLRSLISTFVVCCLDIITHLVVIFEISRL